ncbi:adenylylsulfate kinase [Desulfotomaculum arcticum]|uniref:Adenylyl-sulfate kinase n=1 Tax=Desulfotruncus arcticus DSM 17038 TaxID=1121424 RepID=A0A1I2VKK6_9FIRM|nr:adenylyl-sulfate kinase [Desulfotruncus arcticus]SFG89623.1 adenylylsulfate kinase [Desulfotomaculum arcticum] [Desulfotruncus arcticus DSM 17038]
MSHNCKITKEDRYLLNGHRGCVLWLTGLSGAGKSTLAAELEAELYRRRVHAYVLDGDTIRSGLNNDLGFNPEDRRENIRRIGEVAKLFFDAGFFVLSALISPYRKDRRLARSLFQQGEFLEIYVKCAMAECERRDPKGLYKKARHGIIKNFTGISSPYEAPISPELIIETDQQPLQECVRQIISYLEDHGYFNN